ncbi:MAG: hypothetical protein JWN21_993 [Sphingomonas bacterium]|uniref:hypothetical protein n=1 Tax=Sphingomonas bacterium TaxID=1895847 RepID=UPI002628C395|nr:hypothetical protein [Sphingomonas bacterium]MDB5695450.1 hypothetical protein [Sphingomonas bacterium]
MELLSEINDFLRRSQMPATRFGRLAVRDPRLVGDLKNGRQPGSRMTARVRGFIAGPGA